MNTVNKAVEVKANAVVMSQSTQKLVADAVATDIKVQGKWRKAGDALVADGITSKMLTKPEQGQPNPNALLHKQVEDTIISTLPQHIQEILPKEPKTLNEVDKESRRYWRKQVGSLFNKIKNHVVKIEQEEEDTSSGVVKTPTTAVQRIRARLDDAKKRVRDLKEPTFDVVAVCKQIDATLALMPKL